MFELFLNPLNMIVGGALISSPILIHLINRMRFKRLRWAAMEFLLKSQKRNRRRLIIEQLILLFLRILLVLLAGLLFARFLGFSWAGFQPKNTTHVVVFDDRLSMGDFWRSEDGEVRDCFQTGKQVLEKELAKTIARARTPQRLVFFRLSDPTAQFDRRLNEDALKDLSQELARMEKPTYLHLDLEQGVEAARAIFEQCPQDDRFLHIVSDFRQEHWTEPAATKVLKTLDRLSNTDGVKINLVDTAHPFRSENQKTALYHDNLAVIELRSETRVAAEGMPVQFTVTVANYSASERKNLRLTVKVNGAERLESSVPLASVPPGKTSGTFQVIFTQRGYNEVTANLENEEAGLLADNTRLAAIEVRRQVPVLVIDGDITGGDKPGGDYYHVRTLLTSARGFEVARGSLLDLERSNLEQYPSIYLLNVREIGEKGLKNLENYVREGGSVAFFLGEKVNPDFYNKRLYAGGKGLFPAPLSDRPSPVLSEEERQERQLQNLTDPRYQVFVRVGNHPIFAEAYREGVREFFKFLTIERYYPVPRSRWTFDPGRVEELVTLPNERPLTDYQASAQELIDALPVNDPEQAKFRPALERHRRAVREALTGKFLYQLAGALDNLLRDAGDPADPDRPKMTDFWEQADPKLQALHTRIEKLRETVQYGDPLVIAGRFGKGRIVTFLTTAGKRWNDWAGGGPASVTYPVVMLDLQKYLTGVDSEDNRTVGSTLRIETEASRYDPKVRVYFQQSAKDADPSKPAAETGAKGKPPGLKDLGEQLAVQSGSRLVLDYDKAREPGVYHFDLTQRSSVGGESRIETRAYAFNVDTAGESDLRRAPRDELERLGRLHTPAAGSFADLVNRPNDLSESAWFYLLFLIILVVEQALAVHLSFHLHGSEADLAAPAGRSQAAAA